LDSNIACLILEVSWYQKCFQFSIDRFYLLEKHRKYILSLRHVKSEKIRGQKDLPNLFGNKLLKINAFFNNPPNKFGEPMSSLTSVPE